MRLPAGFRIVRSAGDFERRVEQVVRAIPPGTVASYGMVAAWAGHPGAARAVGGVLSGGGLDDAPWHRVVTAAGRLVPGHEAVQAELLRVEGVAVRAGHVAAPIPWWPGPSAGLAPSREGRHPPGPVSATASGSDRGV